jgi:hypothetical protein
MSESVHSIRKGTLEAVAPQCDPVKERRLRRFQVDAQRYLESNAPGTFRERIKSGARLVRERADEPTATMILTLAHPDFDRVPLGNIIPIQPWGPES